MVSTFNNNEFYIFHGTHFIVYTNQISMLYTSNSYKFTCQLYLSKIFYIHTCTYMSHINILSYISLYVWYTHIYITNETPQCTYRNGQNPESWHQMLARMDQQARDMLVSFIAAGVQRGLWPFCKTAFSSFLQT